MTQFEQAQKDAAEGRLKVPYVGIGAKSVDYFGYQLGVHHFNLKLMATGMKFRGITFTEIKKYYGLKGRSAKDVLEQYVKIMEEYKKKFDEANA